MRVKDKFSKKQTSFIKLVIVFFLIFSPNSVASSDIALKIENYINNLNLFSSKFIQTNDSSLEEGNIYINGNRIRLDYLRPKRTLKISREKGVYINHELKEESFFSTEKNIVRLFYDIFLDYKFFSSFVFKENNKEIVFEKKIIIDSKTINLKIFFENKPLMLRKIIAKTENEIISISFSEHNYNNVFDESLFSFVPIYLD